MDAVKAKNVVNRSQAIPPTLFGAMVLSGIATTMVGPLLPRLESRWHIGDAEAGLLFTGLFLASVMTGALVGPLASRFGHRSVILTGRLLATFALQRFIAGGLLSACLIVAFSGVCLLLVAPYGWVILVAAALIGFAMAPIFPLAVAKYAESTKGDKAAGLIFSAGGLGGASVPALVGYVSEFSGSLRLAMAIAPVLFVTMLLLWTICGLGRGRDQTSIFERG
jgi:MFS family permease